jgi:hypothetical protein
VKGARGMRWLYRPMFLAACVGLGAFAILREAHEVTPWHEGSPRADDGLRFTEQATVDGYVRQNGKLYDAYGLSPEAAREKDCKT